MINDRYIIHNKIGEGRSSVFICKDVEYPNRAAAIKILPPDSPREEKEAFQNEFFTIKKLNHPFIVKAYDYGKVLSSPAALKNIAVGSYFFTLEYIDGMPLSKFDDLHEEKLIEITSQICRALYYLHQSNYLYYDLKPENILIQKNNGKIKIKLIDFGLTENLYSNNTIPPRGTAQYIAPEIIQNLQPTCRADFYSLGMMLYFIIYNSFPFDTDEEISIYKAQVEKEFDYPVTEKYPQIAKVLSKLLTKNPIDRYGSALEILNEFDINMSGIEFSEFTPAKSFAGRSDSITILKKFIEDEISDEVFALVGAEGAGKTTVGEELSKQIDNLIFIDGKVARSGTDYFEHLLRMLCFNPVVYQHLSEDIFQKISDLRKDDGRNYIEKLKAILNNLTNVCSFILVLDDFNNYDAFVLEVYKELIPLIQVSRCKLILTLDSDKTYFPDYLHNLREVNLTPFTENQLDEYLRKSYSHDFPVNDLKRLILLYADLLPGSIELFIKDALLFGLVRYMQGKVLIDFDDEKLKLLKRSHDEIYQYRLVFLQNHELMTARCISSFNNSVDKKIISRLLKIPLSELNISINSLIHKNILSPESESAQLTFSSEGFKKYTYSTISEKKKWHGKIAEVIENEFGEVNINELAYHYELAEEYLKAANIYIAEASKAEALAAFSYRYKILEHLISLPLSDNLLNEIKCEMALTLHRLGESKPCLSMLDEIDFAKLSREKQNELLLAKADSLVDSGKIDEGIKNYNILLAEKDSEQLNFTVLIKIARADIDLNAYDESIEICTRLIKSPTVSHEQLAQCFNILGLAAFYKDDNLIDALNSFKTALNHFEQAGNKLGLSQMYLNSGNIYNMQNLPDKAEESWENSLEINRSIGNLDQEARLLLNFGIFHFERFDFELAIESYKRAVVIFVSLGNKNGRGMALTNLGEIYLFICEYQKAYDSLIEADKIFKDLSNTSEGLETLFLLAKLYFIVGDFDRLNGVVKEYIQLSEDENIPEKIRLNVLLLNLFSSTANDEEAGEAKYISLLKSFYDRQDYQNFFNVIMMLIDFCKAENKYGFAYEMITLPEIENICKTNPYLSAEKDYILGIISEKTKEFQMSSPLDYYLSAYEKIKDLNIVQVTWKILFALSEQYFNRGMMSKTAEFVSYTKSLIYHTGEDLQDSQLKNSYFRKADCCLAFEKLDYLEKHL
jgi:hypothetical protein